ncbi:MAG: chorismate mutase [Firmicutes bacterium HGW-Firmicutes-12]|jgi:chorismate mutase|nr:MAG: chorismate mutase [Firmicutes bacterium HGW-Firmicutes-12]
MRLYGIRGATTVCNNDSDEIIQNTTVLLQTIIDKNKLSEENVVSIIITTTPDLTAEFPAKACRLMGWKNTALLGAVEADVPHGVTYCIRVLVHAYLEDAQKVTHVYLNEAKALRPDLVV